MDRLKTFVLTASLLTLLSLAVAWYDERAEKRKYVEKILRSPSTSWKKVGTVKEIFCYPLKSGKAKSIEKCTFDKKGITFQDGVSFYRDRMFLIFDKITKKILTATQHNKLILVDLSIIDEDQAKLEAPDTSPLIFNLPKGNRKIIKPFINSRDTVDCFDCGDEVSKWFSNYLTQTESGIRLGIYIPDKNRIITKGALKEYTEAFNVTDEDSGIFSVLVSYMLLSESSVKDLNDRMEEPVPALVFRPNILVEDCNPYDEDNWKWIKIGSEAIIKNIKLCTRCSMVRINPDTSIPYRSEPLKTLRTYRKLKDPVLNALEQYSPAMGIYCSLYRTGNVSVGDEIFVYQDDDQNN